MAIYLPSKHSHLQYTNACMHMHRLGSGCMST